VWGKNFCGKNIKTKEILTLSRIILTLSRIILTLSRLIPGWMTFRTAIVSSHSSTLKGQSHKSKTNIVTISSHCLLTSYTKNALWGMRQNKKQGINMVSPIPGWLFLGPFFEIYQKLSCILYLQKQNLLTMHIWIENKHNERKAWAVGQYFTCRRTCLSFHAWPDPACLAIASPFSRTSTICSPKRKTSDWQERKTIN